MGMLPLKAMARGPRPRAAKRDQHPKCWYEPLTDPEEMLMGLRFTLSHPVTAAVPPGDENQFRTALGLGLRLTPLSIQEAIAIKEQAMKTTPLFTYPQWA
jgi:hypothetical protein